MARYWNVTSARYLGVDISNNLSCNMHVTRVVQQMETGLSDLSKETFKSPKQNIQQMAYQTLVRPQLEYTSAKPMWDPHTKENAHKIEMVQRRAAQ